MTQIMIDLTLEQMEYLHHEAALRNMTFQDVAQRIMTNGLDYSIAVAAMRPPSFDPLGLGDGFPRGGDA